ncbi:hypothetical protein COL8621_02091 [Actibacterium lipolyticum]|uniref:Uncharacterized protein n=1 Tax=Actibacterium lipolyticum TaxID=1524263 RepID=A0A238KIY6_9RHOB|nr:hypothetical protein COL8621_02091 [Actibacterium lipolyticum]
MKAAVLTGDIIGSTKGARDALEATFRILSDACDELEPWHGAPLRLTRYRGDGWQCLLPRPSLALRSCLYLFARLRAQDGALPTRISVGLGDISFPGTADLSDANGPAFHNAGHGLDTMSRGRRLVIDPVDAPALAPAVFVLCDAIAQGWSQPQAEALLRSLLPKPATQSDIASSLGIRQQSVADRLDAAQFWAVSEAIQEFEATFTAPNT